MLIILDRDGVINHESDEYIKSPEEWLPIDGSLEAIARLQKAGHTVAIATNQSGVGRGYYNLETLHAMHAKMNVLLSAFGAKVENIYYCPHTPDDDCNCRKPKPGMLLEAMHDLDFSPEDTIFVGDNYRDLEAGWAANCRVALVLTGRGQEALLKLDDSKDIDIYPNLVLAVNAILDSNR